ncbi:GH25 family lysozyme, partial [Bacteroidia bacterium]|nr:GH25 family lysozyme [Bacteroidia bacterium]
MKFLGKIFVSLLLIAGIAAFFHLMKIEPEEHTACNAPGMQCEASLLEEEPADPIVDTAAIIQGVLAKVQEEHKYDFLDDLAGRKLWGIDISKYQKNINWSLMVKRNKPDFVFVKVTEGTTIVDKMYRSHKRNLEKHDILHGAYHFMS